MESERVSTREIKDPTYNGGRTIHGIVRHLVDDVQRERVSLLGLDNGSGEHAVGDGGSRKVMSRLC